MHDLSKVDPTIWTYPLTLANLPNKRSMQFEDWVRYRFLLDMSAIVAAADSAAKPT